MTVTHLGSHFSPCVSEYGNPNYIYDESGSEWHAGRQVTTHLRHDMTLFIEGLGKVQFGTRHDRHYIKTN